MSYYYSLIYCIIYSSLSFVIQRDAEVFHPCVEGLGGYLQLFRGAALVAVIVPDSQFYFPQLVGN